MDGLRGIFENRHCRGHPAKAERLIAAVGQGAAGADQCARLADEEAKAAICEYNLEIGGRFVAKRSRPVERGELRPIDISKIVAPF